MLWPLQFSVGGGGEGGSLSVQNRNMLDKVTMTGTVEVKSITQITDEFSINLALRILDGPSHPLFPEYSPLPSVCAMPHVKTNRAWHLLCQGVFSCLTGWIQVESHPKYALCTLNVYVYLLSFYTVCSILCYFVYHCLCLYVHRCVLIVLFFVYICGFQVQDKFPLGQ